jgi:uncharacterized protein (TIGR02996 family)
MTDHDALVAAICNEPDEDTPRLALADWLDENDEPERASFIRAQIELARTPSWEPFAVLCRWRRREWLTGAPFRSTLPPVDGFHTEWHEEAFHRGLGWRLNVRSLVAWTQAERAILGRAPVGAMQLWDAATLDDWRRFASSPLMRNLGEVHLVASPIEQLRALRESPVSPPITDVFIERASGAGIAFVVEDLLTSPLAKTLRGLHLRMGYESLEDLIEVIGRSAKLARLSLSTMGLTLDHIGKLHDCGALSSVKALDLGGNPLDDDGLWNLLQFLPQGTHTLGLSSIGSSTRGFAGFNSFGEVNSLRRLDLSRNPLKARRVRALSNSSSLSGLRSLALSKSRIGEGCLRWLTRARLWPSLVELDLRENPIPPAGVRHLLEAPIPPDLTALVLTGDTLGADSRTELTRKYGERVVFVASDVVGI